MRELERTARGSWAAIAGTARRGVRAMRVEGTVRRPDRTFPIGVTTTTLDVEPAGEPRVTAIFTDISDSKRLEELPPRAERLQAGRGAAPRPGPPDQKTPPALCPLGGRPGAAEGVHP